MRVVTIWYHSCWKDRATSINLINLVRVLIDRTVHNINMILVVEIGILRFYNCFNESYEWCHNKQFI